MKIGIDSTPLPQNPVGAGVYIIQLIRALSQLETEHELIVFAQPFGRELIDIPESKKIKWIIVKEKKPAIRLIWEQITLPFLVKKTKLDLLHSLHYTRPFFLPCRSIVTFHDMTFFAYPELHTVTKRIFFPLAIKINAKFSDGLIAGSENSKKDTLKFNQVPEQKIHVVPYGIDKGFSPISDRQLLDKCRIKYNLPQDFILYVGLIEPRKNIPSLLRAYHKLTLEDQVPFLVIAGRPGWGIEEVNHYIDALNLKDKVHFTGYVDREDLPMIYNLATIFVYPSIYEGFGFPPLEAMACGTPTITTAISSMPEFVGDACLLVPPQDDEALYQAIKKLLYNKDLQQDLSIKGHQQASQFTWERTARETLEVYQKVMLQP
jgi:glycosyltransferase involved in cell wall biosynthesis